ncbi:hypothetical protein CFIMG_003380RA [Ceratocystis fimbriata CBS 114723]|uniref:Riboflavin kinase n=1 Tax=Ceratocystis fimbriata CBS 114723 TaxID=1035309 RepID=A0A2C5XC18_9PEZI|nr:hypothetical protein CFIMG_003380RA [Ceratocystis fimbriata CBS 114723]
MGNPQDAAESASQYPLLHAATASHSSPDPPLNEPPPPYSPYASTVEEQRPASAAGQQIRRKPIGVPAAGSGNSLFVPLPPPPPPRPTLQLQPQRDIRRVKSEAVLSPSSTAHRFNHTTTAPFGASSESLPWASSASLSTPTTYSPPRNQPAAWKNALGEAQFIAGGLLSRPAESSRHYTVIRHSFALVWYRGPATSVSISILSDEPLSPTRRIFLQQKGYSGNTGMALKAMVGVKDSWTDVTPQQRAESTQIRQTDERAIQRDLARFSKKATGRLTKHVPRETCIVRIPATAQDGYFRLVLCDEKKKVLAACPVFRIASATADSSVVRGAGLRMMPIELGVKVGSTIASAAVSKYTGGPIRGAVGSRVKKYGEKAMKAQKLGTKAYETSGLDKHVQEHQKQYDEALRNHYKPMDVREGTFPLSGVQSPEIQIIGSDTGPDEPFPIKFQGLTVPGTGGSKADLDMPTANLRHVPEHIKVRMPGVYIAWAQVVVEPSSNLDISQDWHEAIVTIAPLVHEIPSVVPRNKVVVHILQDFEDASFVGCQVNVMLMAFVRPAAVPRTLDEARDVQSRDILVAMVSLGRAQWQADEAMFLEAGKDSQQHGQRTIAERLTDLRLKVQDQVDRIPVHLMGLRTDSASIRDEGYGQGGLWIVR